MSDTLLAFLFPAMLLYLGLRLSAFDKDILRSIWTDFTSLFSPRKLHQDSVLNEPFSIQTSNVAYSSYSSLSVGELSRMRASYASVGRTHKRIGYEIGYTKKLDKLAELIEVNAKVTTGISLVMRRVYSQELTLFHDKSWLATPRENPIDSQCLSRVREALKHFIRDWSDDGLAERAIIFEPILSALSIIPPSSRPQKRVLVPGSGLGRLAYEISQLGYDVTACELSGYMNGAFRFLLDPEATTSICQHNVHPFAHWWSHSRSSTDLFRGVRFPDVLPRLAEDGNVGLHLREGDFLKLDKPKPLTGSASGTPDGYDSIVTLFFIDTSVNILSTLEQIHALLKPGGTWVNLGPLLWCSSAQARLELSLDEVFDAMDAVGFTVAGEDEPDCMKTRTIPCQYTHDSKAMMKWIYEAEFWVARKV
ncbi:N2227-domain-containing protein [Gymnopus androsaceus JB14]|uniref:N2227-domain-containing protein n=1 Tax=Gymnopus androsaceus JB14 TaxID=1447944 RepID=A0A6A4HZ80_9AGAR|nr:N2227-domain-containing protein [Gymnopus androsaceus JB14]